MTKIKRLVAVVLSLLMIFGTVSSVASAAAWDATTSDGFALDVTTRIFRQVDGEWIETKKVQKGETVKARVYLDTDFFTNGGDLVFFYNNDFFSDSYSENKNTLAVNSAVYAGDGYGITGEFYNSKSSANVEGRLMTLGVIDQAFADKHNFFSVSVTLAGDEKNNLFLGEEWLCEFDLTVNNDAAGTGDFFILKDSFRDKNIKTNYCNISKGPSFGYNEDVVDMSNWQAVITVASNPVSLYTNYVEATFDANGGEFADGKDSKVISGEAGEALSVDAPVLEGYAFTGWFAEGASEALDTVPALPAADTTYVAQWKSTTDKYDETLKFKTDIYRFDETANDWVYTEKVIPGETVKARIYIDTTYFTNAGDFVVFYDNDFFEETDPDFTVGSFTDLVVNPKEKNDDGTMKIEGTYSYVSSNARVIKRLVEAGHIDQEFADTHTAYLATYKFNPSASRVLSGDDYFAEWTLKVKDSASGTGDFFVVEETIQNASEKGQKAYISIPVSVEGGTDEDSISLFEINVNTDVESHPVSTISRIEFYTDKAQMDTPDFVIEDDINAPVDASTVPEFTKDGYTFKGWVPAEIADPTVDDVVEIPELMPFDEVKLVALWIEKVTVSIDPSNGDPVIENEVTAGDAFEKPEDPVKVGHYLAGWTDDNGNFMTELPDVYPAEDTVYTAVFETYTYSVEYYVFNPETLVFDRVAIANTAYGEKINPVPPLYKVPTGYTLTPAYKDVTFAADTLLAEGETMPANAVKLYYKLVVNKYPATFKLDGGNINGETADVVVETAYGAQIKAPADPVKKGHTFAGWTPVVGLMDTEPLEFIATWEPNIHNATFIVEGEVYEVIDIPYGAEFEYPGDPELPGYIFVEWNPGLPATMPDEDVELTAVWTPVAQDVPVEYYIMGTDGKYPETANETGSVKSETDAVASIAPAEKANYTVDAEKSVLEAVVAADGSTVLKVYYKLNSTKLTITVDGEDTVIEGFVGSEVPAEQIPDTNKPGYTFTGWKDGEGNDVELPTTMPEKDATYEAQYEIKVYNVTFIVDGEVYDGPNETKYGAPIAVPSVPTKNGHTFAAWVDADGKQPSDYAGMPDKNLEFVAEWTANANVGYVLNVYEMDKEGNYPSEPTIVYTFNDGVVGDDRTVTPTVPEGFVLDIESINTPEKSELTGKIPATGTLTLKAYYIRQQFTLYLDVDGEITEEVYYFEQEIADRNDPVKKGWSFEGWQPGIPAVMPAEDVTVVAQFKKNSYTATFDAGEGAYTDGSKVVTKDVPYGESVTKPDTDPVKTGYEFLGWSTDGKTVIENLGNMDDQGKTYIAVFVKSTVMVTFYNYLPSEKGPAVPEGQQTYVYDQKADYLFGETIVFPADPVIVGHEDNYVFVGWVDADGNAVEEGATVPAEDFEIFAKYDRVKVMLIPKNDTCTTVIDRAGKTVDDYTADSTWYVYGLDEILPKQYLLNTYIDVQGDGTLVITKINDNSSYYGTGSIIDVYDNVTGELVESFRIIVFGDINGDSYANGIDLSIMSEEALGLTGWSIKGIDEYCAYKVKAADLAPLYGQIDGQDKALLNQHVLSLGEINQVTGRVDF